MTSECGKRDRALFSLVNLSSAWLHFARAITFFLNWRYYDSTELLLTAFEKRHPSTGVKNDRHDQSPPYRYLFYNPSTDSKVGLQLLECNNFI